MTHDEDERLNHLLQGLAPATRDPLFRIKVLERRERQQFRIRVAVLLGTVVAAAIIYAIGAVAGSALSPVERGLVTGLALAVAATAYVPGVFRLMRALPR